jgi:hypothetical protein
MTYDETLTIDVTVLMLLRSCVTKRLSLKLITGLGYDFNFKLGHLSTNYHKSAANGWSRAENLV